MDVLTIIQCRFASTRLPGKALYPLAGMPMLVFLIRRLLSVATEGLVLATTDRPEDDLVAEWGRHEGIAVIRGESDDVLARYLRCLSSFSADYAVRVTADNPLTDPRLIELVVEHMRNGNWDYVSALKGWPYGVGVDALSVSLLKHSRNNARHPDDREHINRYALDHPDEFRCLSLEAPESERRPDVSLTVDTLEDWVRVSTIVRGAANPLTMTTGDAIARIDSRAL